MIIYIDCHWLSRIAIDCFDYNQVFPPWAIFNVTTEVLACIRTTLPKNLEKLHLEIGSYSRGDRPVLNELQNFLELFKNQLRSLTIITIHVKGECFPSSSTFQNLFYDLSSLETFQYHINTLYQPESLFYPFILQQRDLTHSIFTQSNSLTYSLTLQELFHTRSLSTYCNSGVPSFAFPKRFKLVNLEEIVFEESIEDVRVYFPHVWQWIVQILAVASNLRSIRILVTCKGTKLIIQRLREIITFEQQKQMKHFDIILDSGGDRSNEDNDYPHSIFFDKLSTLFPNLETLILFMDQNELDESYDSLTSFVNDVRSKFPKLIYLTVQL